MRGLLAVLGGAIIALLAACSPLKLVDGLTPSDSYRLTAGIAYGSDPRQQLDIYQPLKPLPEHPVVVFFYGGTWNSGSRQQYRFVGEALASRGILTVVADYRLYPQVRYPDFLKDNAAALAWTWRHIAGYGGNLERLFVMGHSSGAYNASMLALDPRWLAAEGLSPTILHGWIGLAGPYDFLPIENPQAKPVFFSPHEPPDSQPIHHLSAQAPPALLIAANSDNLVNPRRNTWQLATRLREQGVPVQDFYYNRINHITLVGSLARPLRWLAPVLPDIVQFVSRPSTP
ncbi:alpha/beta hydrolase [Pseudomonas eucalypticola]|uniref:Alpha/beta hydrolase n=1 Tax=Pseudomonas eucalypticola TaxID=2599595 RepID=A0A7D5HLC0_9PSED|nr:alpha/beta hydrolase [Pseudomonas eucalypticola]QKZ02868.1 alpha/beta hydrolase [Pseudomonas eucalypticola]